jgi:hypothetical protein
MGKTRLSAPIFSIALKRPGVDDDSLRRGLISLRIRAGQDRQAIAKQCGTSVEMLERSYSFAIEDLEDEGLKPAEDERLRARQLALAGKLTKLSRSLATEIGIGDLPPSAARRAGSFDRLTSQRQKGNGGGASVPPCCRRRPELVR